MRQIIVAGGGASGMMAAISAARAGAGVTILEHNERIGKKILSTGNGRCNFTNTTQEPLFYHSDNAWFPWEVLENCTPQQTIAFFTELGIYSRNKNGYLYPYSEQASAVLDVLRMELEHLGVAVFCQEHIKEIVSTSRGFRVSTVCGAGKKETPHTYTGDAVVLACGSKAAPFTGSDGSGYPLAKSLGHKMVPVVPALVQLKCREGFYKNLAGVRLQGKVSLFVDSRLEAADTGEIQLTNYGISGIPVFQISRFAAKAFYEKKEVRAVLDFMPDFTEEQFEAFLKQRIDRHPERPAEAFFTGIFHKKVSAVLLKISGISGKQSVGSLAREEKKALVRAVKYFETVVEGTNSFEQAQVCAGGVDTQSIDPQSMESRLVPGLFFAGEIVDVDGICGGYNLQWAWSSGYLAGRAAADPRQSPPCPKGQK